MEIQPVPKRSSLATDIARQLHDMIQSGRLKPGERLPGQRELAERFGASMTSVREAVSALAAAGLLEVQVGRGTVVRSLADAEPQFEGWLGAAGNAAQLADLLEARRLLESFTVSKAAREAGPPELARLREWLKAMEAAIADPQAYVEADLAFHLAIAEIAGNRVVARMMKAIQAPLKQQLFESNLRHKARLGHMRVSFETHVRLVEALERGDSRCAVACLEEMVDRASRLIKERIGGT